MNDASASYRPAGALSLATALAPYRGPWNARLAAHLLRRAAFGGSPQDVERLAAGSMTAAVDGLVHYPKDTGQPGGPSDRGDAYTGAQREVVVARAAADPEAVRAAQKRAGEARRDFLASAQRWWLERMINSPAPLQEKMALFWHGHFTTSFSKNVQPGELIDQNWLYRSNALGNARGLALSVSQDPAMLKYLDNAGSVRAHPNENYARELMELFTLGIGNYTERDVRESARAFTGWSVRGPLAGGGFFINANRHDFGTKTFLGVSGQLDGKDIVEIIFKQPAASRWFAQKLLNYLAYNDPEPELVEAVAAELRKHDFETAPVISMLLRSNLFYSARAYRALVKSPVEFVVGAHQLFGLKSVSVETLGALVRMGQILFEPPSVKGWDGGAAWLNSQTLLARENFSNYLVTGQMMMQDGSWLVDGVPASAASATQKVVGTILQGDVSPAAAAELQGYLDGAGTSALGKLSGENYQERMRGAAYLTLAMPAYQLC